MNIRILIPASLIAAAFSTGAFATDGYFSTGYGVKSQGMGGVGIALPQDALAAATNPAGMALIGDRTDIGLTWFRPEREATLSNTAGGFSNGTFQGNVRDNFYIPEAGFNKMLTPDLALGVSVYGNGGMDSAYKGGIPLLNNSNGKTSGLDYIQLFVAPTVAWKVTPNQTIGASVILGYQRFKATGLEGFKGISVAPGNLTGVGADDAYGIGLHLGWIGNINDRISLGATLQSKTYFQNFDKYRGLFAGGGNMDAPATLGAGIAVKATPQLTIAADVQRIFYSDVNSIGNSISLWNGLFSPSGNLGSSSGPSFGWRDVNVYKLGASYNLNAAWTLRVGYNHTDQPVRGSEALFNILAPAVVQDHLTLGGTYVLPNKSELSFNYVHAFGNTVTGQNAIPAQFGGGNVNLKMYQDSVGIAYGWHL
ncbi:outer membrane protein transport protein (OMPP1/FadL/TodX) [mine drainage metagenome]|uniref:Outer membrane protein transport protein (OMPP1/FadL/TodX) n=1 Tax=mine drainage metagenome TaxID=410659 RepID=A0A1J5QRS8_9ZZZZ